MHRSRLLCWLLAGGFLLPAFPAFAEEVARNRFDFQGQIIVPRDSVSPRARISLALFGVGSPFSARTWADSKGRFRFRRLPPGTYTLSLYIPGTGEILQTVEVTKSFADSRGRVEKRLAFDPESLREHARTLPQGVVSVRELSIPPKARREYEKARGWLERGDADGAIRYLQNAVELAPQYLEALNHLGTIHFQRREYPTAESYFRKALEHEPEAFEPLVNLGGVLLVSGRPQEALEINRQAQEARPQDALANAQLGLSYFFLGDYERAVNYLEWTKELDPAHFTNPQIPLAKIYLRRSQEEEALRELEDFLKQHPDSPEAKNVRAMIEQIHQSQRPTSEERFPL